MDEIYSVWGYLRCVWQSEIPVYIRESDSELLKFLNCEDTETNILCLFRKIRNTSRMMNHATTFLQFYWYAFLPSYDNVRWIFPLYNRRIEAVSWRLYNPGSAKGKIYKYLMICLSRLGIQHIKKNDCLLVASKEDTQNTGLISLLKDLLNVRDIHLAFSTGTPGYYRKMTAQVMAEDGKVLAYAKITTTQQAYGLLTQEYRILKHLEELNILAGDIPKAIYYGEFQGNGLLIQSAPSGKIHKSPGKLDKRHIEFLSEIFNKTNTEQPFLESNYWLCIKSGVEALRGRINDQWQKRLQDGLMICESELAGKSIPLGLRHGDFVPWNTTCVKGGRLYVFDWEYAKEQSIPFWDIFHFILFTEMLVAQKSGKTIIKRLLGRSFRELFIQYAGNIAVDISFIPVFLLFYLIDVTSFYLDMFILGGIEDVKRQWLQKTWAEMLDDLATHWEEYRGWR